jgi:hypothetical protein
MGDVMKTPWFIVIVAGNLLASGCTSGHMTDSMDEMRASITDVRAENARHLQACTAAASYADVMAELGHHEDGMSTMMDRMGDAMNGMSHCSAAGVGRMDDRMSVMSQTMSDHRARLEGATDVGPAHAECGEHATTMEAVLSEMHDELGNMSCMGK